MSLFVVATLTCPRRRSGRGGQGGHGGHGGSSGGNGGHGGNGDSGSNGGNGGNGGGDGDGGNGGHGGRRKRRATETEIKPLPSKFQAFDENKDGEITREEFAAIANFLQQEALESFEDADTNRDKRLNCTEFVQAEFLFDGEPSC